MNCINEVLTFTFERSEPHPGLPRFTWAAVGSAGAVHIWAQQNADDFAERYGDRYIGGVECHWPADPDSAQHANCWLLKSPCRHDGSSLYFSEYIGPMLSPENVEGENIAIYMRNELADWYCSKISRGDDA